jgi:hypothetical protein
MSLEFQLTDADTLNFVRRHLSALCNAAYHLTPSSAKHVNKCPGRLDEMLYLSSGSVAPQQSRTTGMEEERQATRSIVAANWARDAGRVPEIHTGWLKPNPHPIPAIR